MANIIEKISELQEYAFVKQNAHFSLAEKSRVYHTYLGIFVTVISTIVGTAIFSTLTSKEDNLVLQVITGFLSVVAAVLASLQTFLRFSDIAEQHKAAALGYETVCHTIDAFLLRYSRLGAGEAMHADVMVPDELEKLRKLEEEAIAAYCQITLQVRETSKAAPTIPDKEYNRFKKQVQASRESDATGRFTATAAIESVLKPGAGVKTN